MELVDTTLGEICDKVDGTIRTGPFGSQLHQEDYCNEGTPVVMPVNLVDGKVSIDDIARIGDDDLARLSQHQLFPGDIVYARRGDIGRRALITEREKGWLCGTGCLRISLGNSVIDPRFLYYYLAQPTLVQWIHNQAVGATMPNLNTSIIRSIPIRYPPLSIQRKIAAILSAYDDLIENNTRRIAILEEMAQLIYREWFVHFRFPGHEDVEMVESELGLVPEGWEVVPVGKAVETVGGGTPRTKRDEYWENGDIVWYTPSDLTAADTMFMLDSSRHINELGLNNSSAKMFPAYSMMMTSRATLGVTAINATPACTNQGFITCVPNERLSVYQLYFWVAENLEKIINLAGGATYKEIRKTTFREMPILVPDEETTAKFVKVVEPIGQQIENLQRKNANLRETRDLLLPRLVSGELDVSGMEVGRDSKRLTVDE